MNLQNLAQCFIRCANKNRIWMEIEKKTTPMEKKVNKNAANWLHFVMFCCLKPIMCSNSSDVRKWAAEFAIKSRKWMNESSKFNIIINTIAIVCCKMKHQHATFTQYVHVYHIIKNSFLSYQRASWPFLSILLALK